MNSRSGRGYSPLVALIDTNVAIHFQDGEPSVTRRVRDLGPLVSLSVISRVELENGVYRDRRWAAVRRSTLDTILTRIATIEFGEAELAAYRAIVEAIGYARARTTDRMIAATALANDLRLVTINGADFRDIPGLQLEIWPSPDFTPPPSATPR